MRAYATICHKIVATNITVITNIAFTTITTNLYVVTTNIFINNLQGLANNGGDAPFIPVFLNSGTLGDSYMYQSNGVVVVSTPDETQGSTFYNYANVVGGALNSPAFSVTSGLADASTNVAAVIDTTTAWAQNGLLTALRSGGINKFRVRDDGAAFIGRGTDDAITSINNALVVTRDLSLGDPSNIDFALNARSDINYTYSSAVFGIAIVNDTTPLGQLEIYAQGTNATAVSDWSWNAQPGNDRFYLQTLNYGSTPLDFYPAVPDAPSNVAYTFGTEHSLTQTGTLLAAFQNSGTNKFTLANDGSATSAGSYTSGNPTGGTAAPWKMGINSGVPHIDISGTGYDLSTGGTTGLANPTATISGSAVNGTATTAMRSDAAPALSALGTAGTYGDATHFPVVTTDANGRVSAVTTNQVAGGITGTANPSASVGLTAVNGSATTAMRSDGAPALSQSIVPTWTGAHTFNNSVTFGESFVQTLETVTYNASTTLSLDPTAHNNMRKMSITGNLTLAVSNAAAGRWFTLIIAADGSTRNLTLPSWIFLNQAAPTTIAANKTAALTVFYTDGTDANAVANYAVQQ